MRRKANLMVKVIGQYRKGLRTRRDMVAGLIEIAIGL